MNSAVRGNWKQDSVIVALAVSMPGTQRYSVTLLDRRKEGEKGKREGGKGREGGEKRKKEGEGGKDCSFGENLLRRRIWLLASRPFPGLCGD